MKKYFFLASILTVLFSACESDKSTQVAFNAAFDGVFYIGAAINADQITGVDSDAVRVVETHFNSITAENVMKSEEIQPEEGIFNFELPDKFVDFGEKNGMKIIGHTLIWHSQLPDWFWSDENGDNVSPEVLKERMRTHIHTIVGRYKGRIQAWDVLNEAILDDGSWRETKFYEILGEDYVRLAFEYTHEIDPDAELYYNDYSMANPGRRGTVIKMVKNLQEQGVKIDGIGMQGHLNMDYPELKDFEESLIAFSELGVKVMITELDLTVLPSPKEDVGANIASTFEYQQQMNPYENGLPDDVAEAHTQRYLDFFKLFIKHHDKIDRVTLWGVNDAQSWKNDWPVKGRTDYTLLFDRNNNPKPIVNKIIEATKNINNIKN